MVEIRHRVGVQAPIGDVYEAVATPEGVARWWTVDVEDDGDAIGAVRRTRAADDAARGTDAADPPRVAVRSGPYQWLGTTATFDLRREATGPVLSTHAGWAEPVEFLHHCSTRWAYFLMSLKHALEGGEATPWPRDEKISSWG